MKSTRPLKLRDRWRQFTGEWLPHFISLLALVVSIGTAFFVQARDQSFQRDMFSQRQGFEEEMLSRNERFQLGLLQAAEAKDMYLFMLEKDLQFYSLWKNSPPSPLANHPMFVGNLLRTYEEVITRYHANKHLLPNSVTQAIERDAPDLEGLDSRQDIQAQIQVRYRFIRLIRSEFGQVVRTGPA